jgi:hypothetical protein
MNNPEWPTNQNENERVDISIIEDTIKKILPINEIKDIFGDRTYLIGGAIRDLIIGKNIQTSDFDLMTRMPLEQIIENFDKKGYKKSTIGKFNEKEYSMKEGVGVINTMINGREIQIGIKGESTIEDLIQSGDINLNCCAFDLGSDKIINENYFDEIQKKELKFCNPTSALDNPMIIISALKQISRLPDLIIPLETDSIIRKSIPSVIEYFCNNKDRKHKLIQILGNINSAQALEYFDEYDKRYIFDELKTKKDRLKISDSYTSVSAPNLSEENKDKLSLLIAEKLGKRFVKDKLFNSKISSVIYKLDENGNPLSCCLMDGERMYLATAINTDEMVKIVSNLCKYNYNIWTTIDLSHKQLIKLSQKTGLTEVIDKKVIEKILTNYNPSYKDKLIVEEKGGCTVFSKKDSDDPPQVLLRS